MNAICKVSLQKFCIFLQKRVALQANEQVIFAKKTTTLAWTYVDGTFCLRRDLARSLLSLHRGAEDEGDLDLRFSSRRRFRDGGGAKSKASM